MIGQNLDIVMANMYKNEPYENKQRIRMYTDKGIKVIRQNPKTTIIKCLLTDDQVHLLFECAKMIKNGNKIVFSQCIPAPKYPTGNNKATTKNRKGSHHE